MHRIALALLLITLLALPLTAGAAAPAPIESADLIYSALFSPQVATAQRPADLSNYVTTAQATYESALGAMILKADAKADARVQAGFLQLKQATDMPAFVAARAQVWTAILAGSTAVVEQAVTRSDASTAQAWLNVREFRTATRFSRPNADATLAVTQLALGTLQPTDAVLQLRADLLDTYQARLIEALNNLTKANTKGFVTRQAEHAALAQGYFLILAPAYSEQRGQEKLTQAETAFDTLVKAAVAGSDIKAPLSAVEAQLKNFRAAPLSAAEQSRRAGQLLRFLSLVPIEYGRGVANGEVTRDLEVQEATTFHAGAYAAFADLQNLLDARDQAKTEQAQTMFETLGKQLADTGTRTVIASPDAIQAQADSLNKVLTSIMPDAWQKGSSQGDFDVIASMLDQMDAAVRSGDYELAESARLEAYAVMETGPEARLMVFAPQLKQQLEDLFWNGQGANKGLAYLIKQQASLEEIKASHAALSASLTEAQTTLGASSAPTAVAANAGLIVFREGLEAVLILASLMSSMKRVEEQKYRKPMWIGTIVALVATGLTWLLAHEVLQSMARYGEKLEAVVSLVAIGILLLITNWFFHKTYWTDWIASFHARKRQLISGEAGLWLGLAVLGFTSVYREGFETVLFLQALVLESGTTVVLAGVTIALLAVVLVGVVTFKMQVNLPYKKMLIITGILIGAVLLQMVGTTTHVMQVVGWLPIHVIDILPLPYWLGTWFGLYATWEGILLQFLAGAFVIGSYYLAEYTQKSAKRSPKASPLANADAPVR
jgi:high-affinity iron transporter